MKLRSPPRPFAKGNDGNVAQRRKPGQTAEEKIAWMDEKLRRAIERLAAKRYETVDVPDEDGTPMKKKREVPLDASRGNAIANLVGRRMELIGYGASRELAQLHDEVLVLKKQVRRHLG